MPQTNRRITGSVIMTPKWFMDVYGIEETNPFTTDLDVLAERAALKSKLLYEKYPDMGIGEPNPIPHYPILQYDPRLILSAAYGAPEPIWNKETATFWHHREYIPWSWVNSVTDVMKIKVPDWYEQPLVNQMLEKYAEFQSRTKYSKEEDSVLPEMEYKWTNPYSNIGYRFSGFMNFIDGTFLYGDIRFFSMLASEPDIAEAMMDKIYEITTDYSAFIRKVYDRPLEGILCFGGDNSCVLSPDMYRRYVMQYDQRLTDRYGRLPVLLHSCGASEHLYDSWGTYPNRYDIVLTQTRALPGKAKRLRNAMPDTYLQLTIHQPQFEFEHEDPDTIRKIVWQFAEDAGYRDLELVVIIAESGEQVDDNIRTFLNTVEEVNDYACSLEEDVNDNIHAKV